MNNIRIGYRLRSWLLRTATVCLSLLGACGGDEVLNPPPDMPRIAYIGGTDAASQGIYVMDADGSHITPLYTGGGGGRGEPAWSPDGTRIAFTLTTSDGIPPDQFIIRDVYTMNADGSGITRLTHPDETGAGGTQPAWSPDGSHIAFSRGGVFGEMICVMNADGSNIMELTPPGYSGHAAWSPDGTRIAFAWTTGGKEDIYIMNADGSGFHPLTTYGTAPAWSPDGTRIAFYSYRDVNTEIYVMNSDGSGVTRLTNSAANDSDPAWSPDGTRIAFESGRDGDSHIYLMNVDGSDVTQLSTGAVGIEPAWEPAP